MKYLFLVLFLAGCYVAPAPADMGAPARQITGTLAVVEITGLIDPKMADHVMDAFVRAEVADADAILVHIASPGGVMGAANDIVQTIHSSTRPVICFVDHAAYSAAYFIFEACPTRVIAPTAKILIHQPFLMDAKHHRKVATPEQAAWLEGFTRQFFGVLASRSTITVDQMLEHCPGDKVWWMSGKEVRAVRAADYLADNMQDLMVIIVRVVAPTARPGLDF